MIVLFLDGVCTFEHGLCGFTTGPNPAGMTWQRVMAPQPLSGNSWPSYDMSTGTERGHYLVAYRPLSANSSISQILSPLYNRPPFPSFETQLCFKFYYHFQAQGDTLTIKLIQEDTEKLLDFLEGDHGYSWNLATYKIANNGSFNVLFEAFLNNTWTYVALVSDCALFALSGRSQLHFTYHKRSLETWFDHQCEVNISSRQMHFRCGFTISKIGVRFESASKVTWNFPNDPHKSGCRG